MKCRGRKIYVSTLLWLLVAAIGCGLAVSCRSSRPAVPVSGATIDARQLSARYDAVADSYGRWERLRVPMSLSITQPKKLNVSGTAVMERDRSISLSFRFFGMEVASVYISADSVCAVDRLHKQYVSESLAGMIAGFPVSIGNIQDLLLGRMFIPGRSDITSGVVKDMLLSVAPAADSWTASPRRLPHDISCIFTFNDTDRLTALSAAYGDYPPVVFSYNNSTDTPAGPVASSTDIDAHVGKSMIDAGIEWNFSKARWNDDVDVSPFRIPKGYSRIYGRDVLKMFGS